ncbi:MAG: hypothetical protein ABF289_11855 [Clostridiales bacterium]
MSDKVVLGNITADVGNLSILPGVGSPKLNTKLAVSLQLSIDAYGNIEGNVNAGFDYQAYVKSGFTINSQGLDTNKEIKNVNFDPHFNLEVRASSKVSISGDVVIYIAGIPISDLSNSMNLYLDSEIVRDNITGKVKCDYDVKGEVIGTANSRLKVEASGKSIIEVDEKFELYKKDVFKENNSIILIEGKEKKYSFNGKIYGDYASVEKLKDVNIYIESDNINKYIQTDSEGNFNVELPERIYNLTDK